MNKNRKNYYSCGKQECPWTDTIESLNKISNECWKLSRETKNGDIGDKSEAIIYHRLWEITESAKEAVIDELRLFLKIEQHIEKTLKENDTPIDFHPKTKLKDKIARDIEADFYFECQKKGEK